ncbi:hypothetical protein CK203_042611 [Vitis vinifera]|uniref:Retrotransposon gag domain-containing protein n=1 Tax=Vitis vinifera TaxID=29760 RepID=A0A438I7W9_VITVI|nr:hypothetical protein CK203_042611 [Vitis vinifera]
MGKPSPLRNPLGTRGSACVEVMTTLHGSTPSPWRRAEGCVPPEGTIASARDPLTRPFYLIEPPNLVGEFIVTSLDSPSWIRVGGRLSRVSDQSDQGSDQRDMDSQVVTVDQFAAAMASIQEAIANLGQRIDGQQTQQSQFRRIEVAPPPITSPIPASKDPHARMDKLEQKLRQMRIQRELLLGRIFDGAPVASLPAKFRMPEIERYTGIGCPRIHLRLYSTVMRAHGLDEAQMRELEALRQRSEESVTSFNSRWREKISQIIDRPSEKDQISMIMRSLQPRFARHLMGFPHTDFGSLVQALYGIEEGIARGLWSESSPTDSKGKRPLGGQRSGDVGAISSAGMRPSRRYQTVGQTPVSQPVFAAHVAERPPAPCIRPRAPQTTTYVQRPLRQFAQLGMPLSRAFQKLTEGGLLTPLASRPLPQPIPPRFRMDLHCSYHQGPGHDMDHCTALRHAIQDLIDQGLVNLGQPSVTTNPLPAHSTHAMQPSSGDIHHMDLIEDDMVPQTPAPFSLIPDEAPFQLTYPTPLVIGYQDTFVPFTLWPEDDDSEGREIQIVTRSGRIAQPPLQQSDHLRVQPLMRRLGERMMRATCIVFSDDDLPPDGLDHVRPLYITVGCSGRRVPSVLLDNGSSLNVCPLATAIALGFAPSDFGPSTQTVRAYDSTKREGRPWIHVAGAIPSSLHQKVKFIHDGQVITVQSTRDMLASSEPVLQISHSEDDLFLTGFTFDEIQTLEIEDFHRDFVAMSFDQHSSTVVLDMMRGMTFLPGMGLGRRQQGPSEFIAAIDHDTTFGLGFIPTEADYRHMARLRKERVRARLSHTPFDYPIRPYRMSLADYFVRGSETRPRLEEIDSVVHTDRETELQHLFHQLQLSDGTPDSSFP